MFAKPSAVRPPAPELVRLEPRLPVPPQSKKKVWIVIGVAATLLVTAGVLLRPRNRPSPAAAAYGRTVKAFRGVLASTIRLSGSVTAKNYSNILGPAMQAPDSGRGMVLTYLPESGSTVKEGEVIARIDAENVREHLDDVEATVSQGELDLRRLRAQLDAESEAIRQRVRVARGNLEKARQDARAMAAKSAIQRELLKLAVEEAEVLYTQVSNEVALVQERQAATLRMRELIQENQVRHRNRHRHDLAQFEIRAPRSGQVVMKPVYRNGEQGQVRVGDQLSPGQLFMRVVDASSLEMETTINQTDSEMLRIGQRATVHFDAYPGVEMTGKVAAVGTLAYGGRRVNYYIRRIPVRIALEGQDPHVIPDLTASADVVISEKEESVIVPRGAVLEEDGKALVYVLQAGAPTPREVEIGGYNNTEASVVSGLEAGEEVVLQPRENVPSLGGKADGVK